MNESDRRKFDRMATDAMLAADAAMHGVNDCDDSPLGTQVFHLARAVSMLATVAALLEDADRRSDPEANARLIAAAPELLGACREATDYLYANHYNEAAQSWDDADAQEVASTLDAAVARAKGGAS